MSFEFDRDSALALWRAVTLEEVRSRGPELTARQLAVLMTVYLTPPPHTVRGLSETLGMPKPAVTRALDALSAQDFISRRRDEADRRSILIARTRAGSAYLGRLATRIKRVVKSLAKQEDG
ncbi:MAG: MarR family transcriptional regulator [Maricaulaceae bacterium]|jgi:DNA-binding MarR family transcriptional regulator